jgi:hypothetical protein
LVNARGLPAEEKRASDSVATEAGGTGGVADFDYFSYDYGERLEDLTRSPGV